MSETDKKVKIWVIKYALTDGIAELEAEIDHLGYASGHTDNDPTNFSSRFFLSRNEYRTSYKEACLAAYAKRDRKIASLEKQIEALKKVKFV